MPTNLTEAERTQIKVDDQLIIEARLQSEIWDTLAIQCQGWQLPCRFRCKRPCRLARRLIDHFMPRYFDSYARWN